MCRYIATKLVAAGVAEEIEVQLAYAIGVADPVSIMCNAFGKSKAPASEIVKAIRAIFPMTPKGMIDHLQLRRPIYKLTAAYGHFGRSEPSFTWEKTDKTDEIKSFLKI